MSALATFKRAFQDAAHPFVAWMTTEGPDAVGLYNPWPELVAEMEAEGAALIGAKPCPGLHGVDNTMRNIEQGSPEMVYVGPLLGLRGRAVTAPTRTFIIGGTHREAITWCRDNGVQPYTRTTIVVLSGRAARGHQIRPEDRVVWMSGPYAPGLREAVKYAGMAHGRNDTPPVLCSSCGKPEGSFACKVRHIHLNTGDAKAARDLNGAAVADVSERLWARVDKLGPSECWEWQGATRGRGYGAINVDGRDTYTHRVAWELANGRPLPDGAIVLHSCDNPPCVNPAHLREGSHAENMRDMVAKGRQHRPDFRGARHPRARLTAEQVRMIRDRHAEGQSTRSLADEYEITPGYVRDLCNRGRRSNG